MPVRKLLNWQITKIYLEHVKRNRNSVYFNLDKWFHAFFMLIQPKFTELQTHITNCLNICNMYLKTNMSTTETLTYFALLVHLFHPSLLHHFPSCSWLIKNKKLKQTNLDSSTLCLKSHIQLFHCSDLLKM